MTQKKRIKAMGIKVKKKNNREWYNDRNFSFLKEKIKEKKISESEPSGLEEPWILNIEQRDREKDIDQW